MGLTIKQIKERLKVSDETINKILRKHGLAKRYMTQEDRDAIVKMRERGLSIDEITEEIGRTRKTVSNVLLEAGFVIRRYSKVMGTPLEEECIRRYRNGESGRSIIRDTGISKSSLRDLVIRNGLDRGNRVPTHSCDYTADLDSLTPREAFPINDSFNLHEEERNRLEEIRAAKIKNWNRLNQERTKNEVHH